MLVAARPRPALPPTFVFSGGIPLPLVARPTRLVPSCGLAEVRRLAQMVEDSNACALPGCPIKHDSFLTVLWRAVARGHAKHVRACFVAKGLRHGLAARVLHEELYGQRVFKNYKTAVDDMGQVGRATPGRTFEGKTLLLGHWGEVDARLRDEVEDFYCFPLGAVPKTARADRGAADHFDSRPPTQVWPLANFGWRFGM